MRTLLFTMSMAVLGTGCASTNGVVMAQEFRCTGANPRDITIPVELNEEQIEGRTFCVPKVMPPDPSQPVPRACRARKVTWAVKNNCSGTRRVMIAFSPFENNGDTTKDVRRYNNDPRNIREISDRLFVKARATKAGNPGPCPQDRHEICGIAYKYDIYVEGRLALDPELEVEY